jgi:beta-mannosidase
MPVRLELTENWTLHGGDGGELPEAVASAVPRGAPAPVPGCVHTDLLAARLIDDPYVADHENRLAWIGRAPWRYATTVSGADIAGLTAGAERVDLVCEGLDTVAEVAVNGRVAGRTQNMHRSYRFDVTSLLGEGDTEVSVAFSSAYDYTDQVREQVGPRPGAYDEPYQFIRKMACNFGWDWGPTLVTAGIWRPIALHAWSTARLARVRPEITVETAADGTSEGVVRIHAEVERTASGQDRALALSVEVAGRRTRVELGVGDHQATAVVRVPDARLWWPRTHGEQPLYEVQATVEDVESGELDSWRRRVGFRTVELDTRPDDQGTPFTIRINGRPVFIRGANWIPDDCFPTRVDTQRYARRVDQAVQAGMNLLRIWGGGRYESEEFYRICDERGVLVWQDFLFACAAYPEEEPLYSEVEAEAREAVVRLADHPSLVLWCGNNENIWGHADWGWQEELDGRTWGEGYYLDLLPRVVAELDPTRPYWPGSPYSGPDRHPNDSAHGPMHIWDVWNERDYGAYREYRPRFVAEFGFQGPPAHATLRDAVGTVDLRPQSPALRHRQRAEDGMGKLARGLAPHFGEVRSSGDGAHDDWHYLTQINQARAISLGIEHFRAQWPRCTGSVMWQLNDCWPVVSWSAVDGAERRKPLWYALRRVYRERLVTVQPEAAQPEEGGLSLVLVNDTDLAWHSTVRIARRDFSGALLAEATLVAVVPSRGNRRVALDRTLTTPADPARELITVDATDPGQASGTQRAWWFFAEDVDMAYPEPNYEVKTQTDGEDLRVTVVAGSLLRDLSLFPDRLHPAAEADECLVTLLPGESHTFTVSHGADLDPAALATPPVLNCINAAIRRREV